MSDDILDRPWEEIAGSDAYKEIAPETRDKLKAKWFSHNVESNPAWSDADDIGKQRIKERFYPGPDLLDDVDPQPAEAHGLFGDTVSAIGGGITDALETTGRAIKTVFGDSPGTDDGSFGSGIVKASTGIKNAIPILKPQENEGVGRWLYEGARSAVQSMVSGAPGAAIGYAAGLALAPFTGGLSAGIAPIVGAIAGYATSGGALFGLAEYDKFMEEAHRHNAENPHRKISQDAMEHGALSSAIYEGGFEFVSNAIEAALLGTAKPFSSAAKATFRQGLKRVIATTLRDTSKRMAGIAAAEVPTEMATAYLQTAERKNLGMTDQTAWQAMTDAFGPSLVASIIFGGVGELAQYSRRRDLRNSIENGNVPEETRQAAVNAVYEEIRKYDENIAQVWHTNATEAVKRGETIPLDDDVAAFKILKDDNRFKAADLRASIARDPSMTPEQAAEIETEAQTYDEQANLAEEWEAREGEKKRAYAYEKEARAKGSARQKEIADAQAKITTINARVETAAKRIAEGEEKISKMEQKAVTPQEMKRVESARKSLDGIRKAKADLEAEAEKARSGLDALMEADRPKSKEEPKADRVSPAAEKRQAEIDRIGGGRYEEIPVPVAKSGSEILKDAGYGEARKGVASRKSAAESASVFAGDEAFSPLPEPTKDAAESASAMRDELAAQRGEARKGVTSRKQADESAATMAEDERYSPLPGPRKSAKESAYAIVEELNKRERARVQAAFEKRARNAAVSRQVTQDHFIGLNDAVFAIPESEAKVKQYLVQITKKQNRLNAIEGNDTKAAKNEREKLQAGIANIAGKIKQIEATSIAKAKADAADRLKTLAARLKELKARNTNLTLLLGEVGAETTPETAKRVVETAKKIQANDAKIRDAEAEEARLERLIEYRDPVVANEEPEEAEAKKAEPNATNPRVAPQRQTTAAANDRVSTEQDAETILKNAESSDRNFIRIPDARNKSGLPDYRFDDAIKRLAIEKKIQLHGGDPAAFAEGDKPFIDANGRVRWTFSLVKEADEKAVQKPEKVEPLERPETVEPADETKPEGKGIDEAPATTEQKQKEVVEKQVDEKDAVANQDIDRQIPKNQNAKIAEVSTGDIIVDSTRFQYKRGTGKGGATDKLREVKKYNPELGGIISVWLDPANGKTYVVNGHHRYELASRTGYPTLLVRYLDATTAEEARLKGALINIAEGQGTPEDAAVVFRKYRIKPSRLQSEHGISLKGPVAREGAALSVLHPNIFIKVESGEFPKEWGVVIGENLENEDAQLELFRFIQREKSKGRVIGAGTIKQIITDLAGVEVKTEVQATLFGDEINTRPLLIERAELKDYAIKQLTADKRLFGLISSSGKEDRLKREGNILETEKNRQIAQDAELVASSIEKFAQYKGPINDVINKYAKELSDAKAAGKRNDIKRRFITEAMAAVVEQLGIGKRSDEGNLRYDTGGVANTGVAQEQLGLFGDTNKVEKKTKEKVRRKQKQLDLELFFDEKPVKEQKNEKAVQLVEKVTNEAGKDIPIQGSTRRTRMATTGYIGYESMYARNVDEVASLLAGGRKFAQERVYVVATDDKHKILEIHAVSKGTDASAPFQYQRIAARIMRFPDAKHVYFAHNHPSGNVVPSKDDISVLSQFKEVLKIHRNNLSVDGIILSPSLTYARFYSNGKDADIKTIIPAKRGEKIPVKEQYVTLSKSEFENASVGTPLELFAAKKKIAGDQDGFLFLDASLRPVGFMPWVSGEGMTKRDHIINLMMAIDRVSPKEYAIFFERMSADRLEFIKVLFNSPGINPIDAFIASESLRGKGVFGDIKMRPDLTKDLDNPLYSATTRTAGAITEFEVQAAVGKGFTVSKTDTGFMLHPKQGRSIPVRTVDHIPINEAAFERAYGRKPTQEELTRGASGVFVDGEMQISPFGDQFTVTHEVVHAMFEAGVLSFEDVKAIAKASGMNTGKMKRTNMRDYEESVAAFIEDAMIKRTEHTGRIGQIVRRIADFIDSIVNLFKRTARGVVRDFESGRLVDRGMGNRIGDMAFAGYSTPANVWFSQMENVLAKKLNNGKPEAVKNQVRALAKKEFKESELEWSGFMDWLDRQTGKVTKEKVLEYLRANRVEIVDVFHGNNRIRFTLEKTDDGEWTATNKNNDDYFIVRENNGFYDIFYGDGGEHKGKEYSLDDVLWSINTAYGKSDVKWDNEELNVPGSDRQFELLLRMPAKKEDDNKFYSSHFDEDNIIVHIRFDIRNLDNGELACLIQEVQSDLHQEGRDKGYSAVPNAPFKNSSEWAMLAMKRMVRYAAENGIDRIMWTPGKVHSSPGDPFPFDRYGSEKIVWKKLPDGSFSVMVNTFVGGQILTVELPSDEDYEEEQGDIVRSKDDLYEAFAKKILQGRHGELDNKTKRMIDKTWNRMQSNESGTYMPRKEGMEGFYDNILPKEMSRFFSKKSWGNPKVEKIAIPTDEILDTDIEVWSIPVTPEMKSRAMREGMPMFSTRQSASRIAVAKQEIEKRLPEYARETIDAYRKAGSKDKHDISTMKRIYSLLSHHAKEVYGLHGAYKAALKRPDVKERKEQEMFVDRHDDTIYADQTIFLNGERLIPTMERFKKESGEAYGKTKSYLTKKDQDAKGDIIRGEGKRFVLLDSNGARVSNHDTEREAEAAMMMREHDALIKSGFSAEAAKFVVAVRKINMAGYHQLRSSMDALVAKYEQEGNRLPEVAVKINDEDIKIDLKQAMAMMGDRRGYYMPRIRKPGQWLLRVRKNGEHPELHIGNRAELAIKSASLKKSGYEVDEIRKTDQIPEDVYTVAGSTLAINEIVNKAMQDVEKSDEVKDPGIDFANIFAGALADVLREHGARRSMLRRSDAVGKNVTIGYEEDPIRAVVQSAKSIAGAAAKQESVMEMVRFITGTEESWSDFKARIGEDAKWEDYKALVNERKIDSAQQPNAYRDATELLRDILRNDEAIDRVFGAIHGAAVLKYMGFRVFSAPVMNTTAMFTNAPAVISHFCDVSIGSALSGIGKAYGQYYNWSKGGNMNDDLKAALDHIHNNGWHNPQMTRESITALQGVAGRTWSDIIDKSMYVFGVSERLNRIATILGAYNAIKAGSKGAWTEGKRIDALNKAKEASDRAHGVYDKANKPAWARGSGVGANVARAAYLFQTFTHNFLLTLKEVGWDHGDLKNALWMVASPAVLFGAGASLATPALLVAMGLITGDDDPEESLYEWMYDYFGGHGERVARLGLSGLAGVNFKGSVQIGSGSVPTKIGELLGAPGSVLQDVFYDMPRHIMRGEGLKAAESFLPNAFASPIKAYRESTEGVTKKSGAPVFYGREPLKATMADAITRSLGFNPARLSSIRDQQWNDEEVSREYSKQRELINAKVMRWFKTGMDKVEWADIVVDIQEYNATIRRNNRKDEPVITGKYLKENLKRNLKPNKREKLREARQ